MLQFAVRWGGLQPSKRPFQLSLPCAAAALPFHSCLLFARANSPRRGRMTHSATASGHGAGERRRREGTFSHLPSERSPLAHAGPHPRARSLSFVSHTWWGSHALTNSLTYARETPRSAALAPSATRLVFALPSSLLLLYDAKAAFPRPANCIDVNTAEKRARENYACLLAAFRCSAAPAAAAKPAAMSSRTTHSPLLSSPLLSSDVGARRAAVAGCRRPPSPSPSCHPASVRGSDAPSEAKGFMTEFQV